MYYGEKGHGKGLVDAMSGFGLKTPLRNAIVMENVFYDSAEKVHAYFMGKEQEGCKKVYRLLDSIAEGGDEQFLIPGIQKTHMLSFFPSGQVQRKEQICTCTACYNGNFILCENQYNGLKGRIVLQGDDDDTSDEENDDEEEDDADEGDEDEVLSDMEENELFTHTDIEELINPNQFIAIYSHETAKEGFFLCKVISKKYTKNKIDDGQHNIPAETDYMICQYLEKGEENFRKRTVEYKLVPDSLVYVTYEQVFYPQVIISPDMKMSLEDYLCISESALSMTGRVR